MATSAKIHLRPEDVGIMNFGKQSQETAEKTSDLLQQNHNNHHIFFNEIGFHNHIVHHTLTLYGLGAPSSVIQKQYDYNKTYQRPQLPIEERVIEDMNDPIKFKKYLGNRKYYQDFLVFFQRQIEENEEGWEGVLKEFLWKGDERADDLLVRTFAGLLHPLIHLGFAIEFNQPAIIAEALAQAACHDNYLSSFYLGAEKAAAKTTNTSSSSPTLVKLLHAIKADKKLSTSAHWNDSSKIKDGVMVRARDEMIDYASKWTVNKEGGEEELEKKTVEMIQSSIYIAAGAQRPPKEVKFDFFFIHPTNASIFFPTFNSLPFLTLPQKSRLLEWASRLLLLTYVSWNSPSIIPSEFKNYIPKHQNQHQHQHQHQNGNGTTSKKTDVNAIWKDIFNKAFTKEEDGHVIKLLRAVRFGKEISKKYENEYENESSSSAKVEGQESGKDWIVVKGDTWEKIGHMVLDSVESEGAKWVRGAGFEEAWSGFVDRDGGGGGIKEVEAGVGGLRL